MKLGTKLFGAFLVVSLFGAAVSAVGIRNASTINDANDLLYLQDLTGLSDVKEANIGLLYVGRSLRNALLAPSDALRAEAMSRVESRMKEVEANLNKARPLFVSEAAKAKFALTDQYWQAYKAGALKLGAMVKTIPLSQNSEMSGFLFGDYAKLSNALDDSMTVLAQIKEQNAKRASEETTVLYENARTLMVLLVLTAVAGGIGFGYFLARSITRQLGAEPEVAADLAKRVAEGDLTTPITLRKGDEQSVMAALQAMQASLSAVVANVRGNAESVATASAQIAQGNTDLSQRTEEQASALEETAATMEQLNSTVRNNADNAKQANQLAQNASGVASKGGAVVAQMVDTMHGINESSKRIAEIISVIDGIAFQTNILALNAAVEAARAGDQGRGFAVVASEVRTLAQRSAEAAKEIKTLITNSVEQVDKGSALVGEAGVTMEDIVRAIQRVTEMVSDISLASVEQSNGVSQVGQAVSQMDQVTQQNAALVEESAAAAESLKQQAGQLVQLVSVFKLNHRTEDGHGHARGAAVAGSSRNTSASRAAVRPSTGSRAKSAAKPAASAEPVGQQEWAEF